MLALALHQRGIPVRVFEAVPELKPLGVGINLLPHSVRVLRVRVARRAGQPGHSDRRAALCEQVWPAHLGRPRGVAAGYNFPYSIHRGELQMLLYETANRLGADSIQTGCALADWADETDGIRVQLRGADGAQHEVMGRCLIAADGIHSQRRSSLPR
ncbi:MAG: FAD-dependent monooxygenase [Caldilineaceae bacterium]